MKARAWRGVARVCWVAALGAWGVASAPAAAAPAVDGLIVKLKSAPSHEQLLDAPQRVPKEQARWKRVLAESALTGASGQREPVLRAIGRDHQQLHFGRRLSADEAERIAERLRRRPEVAWVEHDSREQRLQVPTDPQFAQQWWLQSATGSNNNSIGERLRGVPGFLRAWQSGIAGANGAAAATVAVLDTGTTPHPDLVGRFLPGWDFVSESSYGNDGNGRDADPSDPGDWVTAADVATTPFTGCDVSDSSWHGTLIAGVLAAVTDNGIGVAGINRNGRILPVRVAGKCGAALSDIIDGMRWAAGLAVPGVPMNTNPVRVVNISFGGTNVCGNAYQQAIDELRAVGVVVVAAAGNTFTALPNRPASCVGTVGVAALNRDGFKSTYSNFGPALSATGIATVGGDDGAGRWGAIFNDGGLLTVYNDGKRGPGIAGYAGIYGTSFAAPLVAGTISLMLSVNPGLSWEQVVAGLRLSARPHVVAPRIGACSDDNPGRCICSTTSCGVGILDAEQALRYAAAPSSYVPPARQGEVIDNADVNRAVALGADRGGSTPPVVVPEPAPTVGGGGSGGGGGTMAAPWWLAALVLAVVALRRATAASG
jgi:serine protease